MVEFKELRSGKDLAYYIRRTIKFREFGGKSAEHSVNNSVYNNSQITVYDYDIKL